MLRITHQVLSALGPLHECGVLHGGIKPSNLFLGGQDRVLLGDPSLPIQGIGVALDRLSYDFRYAPPEMFRGSATLEPNADFYALGCVLYELLCGQPPFSSDNHYELIIKHAREPVPHLRCRGNAAKPGLDSLLQRLLMKSPAERFRSVQEALQAVAAARQELRPRPLRGGHGPQGPPDWMSGQQSPGPEPDVPDPSLPLLRDASVVTYEGQQSLIAFVGYSLDPNAATMTLEHRGDVTIAPAATPPAPPVPQRVGNYTILGTLGRRGLGVVYEARHHILQRVVALKMVVAAQHADPSTLSRFQLEAQAVAQLQHPNIVQIFDIGYQDGLPYLALEYVDGGSLARQLRDRSFSAHQAAELLQPVARAIHYAHERGIVHRDLKPSNLLLTADGIPKITDFGLAKLLTGGPDQTRSGEILGTPAYMAPEQASGEAHRVGPGADIYALGAILYELLTARPPFRGDTAFDTVEQVRTLEPVPPRRLRAEVPRDLETICLKCLDKEPARRYPSAEALAEDLGRFLAGEPITARASCAWERAVKWVKRNPAVAALYAIAAATSLASAAGLFSYLLHWMKP
jgi:serine/threonine protein kinase